MKTAHKPRIRSVCGRWCVVTVPPGWPFPSPADKLHQAAASWCLQYNTFGRPPSAMRRVLARSRAWA